MTRYVLKGVEVLLSGTEYEFTKHTHTYTNNLTKEFCRSIEQCYQVEYHREDHLYVWSGICFTKITRHIIGEKSLPAITTT